MDITSFYFSVIDGIVPVLPFYVKYTQWVLSLRFGIIESAYILSFYVTAYSFVPHIQLSVPEAYFVRQKLD